MTLYEFKMLNETDQYNVIWDKGVYLDSIVENEHKINIYAIDRFFVEVVYDSKSNKIIENRPFKEGHRLDKYSKSLKKYF